MESGCIYFMTAFFPAPERLKMDPPLDSFRVDIAETDKTMEAAKEVARKMQAEDEKSKVGDSP